MTYGLVGKLDYDCGFLIAISKRQLVGTIHGENIFRVREILVIPLRRQEALETVASALATGGSEEVSETEDDESLDNEISHEIEAFLSEPENCTAEAETLKAKTSIIEEVFLRKPPSRGWKKWFSRERRGSQGSTKLSARPVEEDEIKSDIVPKLVKSLRDLFSCKACYFCFGLDLTNSLQQDPLFPPYQNMRQAFCYNRHISSVFAGTSLQLPIVQGYFEQFQFTVDDAMELDPEKPVRETEARPMDTLPIPNSIANNIEKSSNRPQTASLYIVSRRSTHRAGVRYMRRGIDANGYCANWVETEQVFIHRKSISSYVQVRGSIPLYFTQSPYRLTPTPRVVKSEEDNYRVLDKHFTRLLEYYGQVACISLVEKPPSKEEEVGLLYQKLSQRRNIPLEWFDFHRKCKGMLFELVEGLFDTKIGQEMIDFGYSDKTKNLSQTGIFRTNCIDCLDRTNVVQATCARRILQLQLDLWDYKLADTSDFDVKFNNLWANHGDAISNQYSNTNALKGDFTRTRHRNYKGVLTDAFLTLSRYYYGVVSDFFTQAVIDYIEGVAGEDCFDLFEQEMQVSDPALEISSFRENAIEVTQSIVVASDKEKIVGGWWLLTPVKPDTVRRVPMKDCILIVTDAALYVCDFELVSEKVTEYRRIPREAIRGIQVGEYFGEILSKLSRSSQKNQGIVIQFSPQHTLRAVSESKEESDSFSNLAFKVPLQYNVDLPLISTSLRTLCSGIQIEEKPIVSLEEALSDTPVWDSLEYQLKKAIWA